MVTFAKTVLTPEMIPSVAIDFMNNTHFEEIALVQDLANLVSIYKENISISIARPTKEESNKITHKIHNWLNHTKAHFLHENELMEEYQFPAYAIHAQEHEIALEKMQTVINRWQKHQDIELLSDYIFHLWPKWFSGHVNSMDMMTAQFAVMNGFSPD
jgi:hemerythrin